MATSNVIRTVSGTGFTVDVTVCNLDSDVTLRDFIVLTNGTLTANTSYTKLTPTTLNYSGTALPANTSVEVRRKTPTAVIQQARFGSRLRSDDWNKELDRVARRAEEYDLNGVGNNSITQVQTPKGDPFGALWSNDTVFPPTRKAVYDWGINLVSQAQLTTILNTYATDSEVAGLLTGYATTASPAFTGTPTAPTPTLATNNTQLVTTAAVHQRLQVSCLGLDAPVNFAATPTTIIGWLAANELDRSSAFSRTTGIYTCPLTGYYRVSFIVPIVPNGSTVTGIGFVFFFNRTTSSNMVLATVDNITTFAFCACSATAVVRLVQGNEYDLRAAIGTSAGQCQVTATDVSLSLTYESP